MRKIVKKFCLISLFIACSTANFICLTSCKNAGDDFTKKLAVEFEENSDEGTDFTLDASGSDSYTTLGHFVVTYGGKQIINNDDLTFEFVCDDKDFDSSIYDIKNSVSVNYAQNIVFQNNATECFSNVTFSVNVWYHLHSDDVQYVHYCDKNFTISSEDFSIVWKNSNLEDLNFSLDDTTKPYISVGYFIPYFNGEVVDPNSVEFSVVYDEKDLELYHLDEIEVIPLENNECHIKLPAPSIETECSFKLNFSIHAEYTSQQGKKYVSNYDGFQVTKKMALPIDAFRIEINQFNKKILYGMSDDYINNHDKYKQYDSIIIPNDIDEIETGAFAQSSLNSNIKYISFEKDSKISVIPYNFIYENNSITDIDFKNATQLESIQNEAFCNASALKNVDFSNCINLAEIHDSAFAHSSLESIDLSSCSNIKFYSFAFYKCLNLVELILPSHVVEIDSYAFSDCIGLRLIIWNQNDTTYTNTNIGSNAFLNIYSDPNEYGVLKSSNLTISSNILSWLQGKDGTGVKGNFPIDNWKSSN